MEEVKCNKKCIIKRDLKHSKLIWCTWYFICLLLNIYSLHLTENVRTKCFVGLVWPDRPTYTAIPRSSPTWATELKALLIISMYCNSYPPTLYCKFTQELQTLPNVRVGEINFYSVENDNRNLIIALTHSQLLFMLSYTVTVHLFLIFLLKSPAVNTIQKTFFYVIFHTSKL